jgi:hypothetical protein
MAACMSSSVLSDATTTSTSSATTTLIAGSPLLDIVLCSSLSAATKYCGGVDFVATLGLNRKNR